MALIKYIPNRVIDTNGISDGASLYVYQAGTSTPVSLYSDAGLTTPVSNPYVVAAGAEVPDLYHNYAGEIRLRVVETGGTVAMDEDPYLGFRVTGAGDIGLFTGIASQSIDSGFSVITTSGYSSAGVGAARYVADATANATLASNYPTMCKADAAGRYFRLLPDSANLIVLSQAGCIGTDAVDHSTNQQPLIQKALDYARAVGAYGIRCDRRHYSIWTPLRDSDAYIRADGIALNQTGFPITIYERQEIHAAPAGTSFWRRKNDGSDPNVFSGTQVLNPKDYSGLIAGGGTWTHHWRGGMFFLKGQDSIPSDFDDLAFLVTVGDLTLEGGIPMSNNPGLNSPSWELKTDGKGWDISDKPVWFQQDKYVGGMLVEGSLTIRNFRGELVFGGSAVHGGGIVNGTIILEGSDGDGWNLSNHGLTRDGVKGGCRIERMIIRNVYQALEGTAGPSNSYINTLVIENCITGGIYYGGDRPDTTDTATYTPVLSINHLTCINAGDFTIGRWMKIGTADFYDTAVLIGGASANTYNTTIGTMTVLADRENVTTAVTVSSRDVTAGTKGTRDFHIGKLVTGSTAYGLANAFAVTFPLTWQNSLGKDCFVSEIYGEIGAGPRSAATTNDFRVAVGNMRQKVTNANNNINIETGPTLDGSRTYVNATTTTTTGNFPVTLPSVSGKVSAGDTLVIRGGQNANVLIAIQTTNTTLNRRIPLPAGAKYTFECDGAAWVLKDEPLRLIGSTTANLQKGGAAIPAGDVSDETTFTVNGAVAGMRVSVAPTTAISGDALLMARVTAANTVGIRAKNVNLGGTLAIGSATYRVELEYPN